MRISFLSSKSRELSKYMADTLDDDWRQMRGMEVQSVGLASISYDEESQKLINMRNQGAMLGDPSVREGYVQGAMARGFEAAGSNGSGAMAGFMGMGAGMNFGGGFMGAASASNLQQMQMQQKLMQMQQEMAKAQQEVEEATFTASVGGGAVSAAANGKKEITALTIKPEAVDPEDVEMLQDLVISAVNEALRQADDAMSSRMNSFTSGLNIPGLGL